MKRIFLIVLVLVSYIEAELPSLPCRSDYCICDQSTSEITWECTPPSLLFPDQDTSPRFLGEGVPKDYLYLGIGRSVELKLEKASSTLNVDCSNFVLTNTSINADIYEFLPDLSFGPLDVVKFRFCPLPNVSFQSFLMKLNITKVTSLYFSHSQSDIRSLSPPYFDNISTVEFISLTDNANLTQLHTDLFKWTPQLKNLNLRGNNISGLDSGIFQYLPKLKILDLSNNNITDLDPGVFRQLTSLKILNIDYNKIVNLTRTLFSNVPNLESLSISGNTISVLPPDVFSDLIKLKTFQANKNKFQTFPRDLFSRTKMLNEIKISYHKSTLVDLPSGLFSNLPELTTVKLQESGIKEIPADLFWNSTKLSSISIMGHKKMTTIPRDLFKDCGKLVALNLSNNKLKNITEGLFSSMHVRELDLSKNQIEKITK